MAKKKAAPGDVLTAEQLAAEERRQQQEAQDEYTRATWENFARNVALQVAGSLAVHEQDAATAGRWVALYCMTFRKTLDEYDRPATKAPTESKTADPPGVQGQPDVS